MRKLIKLYSAYRHEQPHKTEKNDPITTKKMKNKNEMCECVCVLEWFRKAEKRF